MEAKKETKRVYISIEGKRASVQKVHRLLEKRFRHATLHTMSKNAIVIFFEGTPEVLDDQYRSAQEVISASQVILKAFGTRMRAWKE